MTKSQMTHIVAGCVLEQNAKYLLVQEKKASAYGLWNLPGGRMDVGESFEDAAIREVAEETGYAVEIVGKLCIDHTEPLKPVLHSYRTKIISGELKFPKEELLDARWFTLDEVKTLWNEGNVRAKWVVESIERAALPAFAEQHLIDLERGFWAAAGNSEGGKYYEENFDDAGMLLLPFEGGMFDKLSVLPIIPKSESWKNYDFSNVKILPLTDTIVELCYEVQASHGNDQFHAYVGSVYILRDNKTWKLLSHQQTAI